MINLKGKTALVTGASRGIGRAIALGLARCGADLIVNYVHQKDKACEVQKAAEQSGVTCELIRADLSAPDCAEKLVQRPIDILILNASVQFRNGWEQISIDEFDTQINCNLRSAMLLMQKAVPSMKEKGWGRIITIGSVQETKPHPDMLIYSASKAALTNMAKSLALQLAPFGITVNSVAPGVIATDRNTDALADPVYAKSVQAKIPSGRYGQPEDCAGIIQLLCSEKGEYITGQNIFVDGGMAIK